MPAHTVTEATFTATSAAAIQADASPRTPPTNRYRVRIVNTHASVRMYIGTTAAGAGAPTLDNTCPVVEADFGVWEDWLDPNVAVWCKSTGADVTVRIVQYATT